MAKRKHKKITPADEPEPGTRRSPRRAPTAASAVQAPPPTTPAVPPTAPLQSPVEATSSVKRIAKARAGLMSPEERQELYGLVAATMEALTRDEATKQKKADDRASEHAAKKRRAAKASIPDAGARAEGGGILSRLPYVVASRAFAFLRAEEFRRLASIKCFQRDGGAKVLRAGVKAACAEIAPYASPPQLTLALRGYEPLAVLEDIAARSSEFLANPDPEALLRVRLIAPLHGADIFSTSFTMSFADYCLLRDCPVTNPRPRCERDVTVAGSVLEILRREPDVFVRTAPDWLGEWLRKFLRDDDVYRATTDDPSSSRFLMLDAAGFAPALRGAVTRASRAKTARKLADALRDVLRDPDAAVALVDDPARAARWRAAVRACLRKLLTHVKRRDQFDDGTCTCLWRCVDATVIRSSGSYLLSSDEVWDEITRADPDATVVTWAIGKISGAANDNDPTFENYSVVSALQSLARYSKPVARKLVALGALGACARVRDGTVRSSKLFGSTVDQLYAKLEASTRPPPEPMPRKKWPTFADCLRDAEDKIHAQAEAKLGLVRKAEQDLEREQAEFSSSTDPAPGVYLRQIPTGTEEIDVEAGVLDGLEVVEAD